MISTTTPSPGQSWDHVKPANSATKFFPDPRCRHGAWHGWRLCRAYESRLRADEAWPFAAGGKTGARKICTCMSGTCVCLRTMDQSPGRSVDMLAGLGPRIAPMLVPIGGATKWTEYWGAMFHPLLAHANPGWVARMPCVSSCVKFGIRRVRNLENCLFSPNTRDSTRSVVCRWDGWRDLRIHRRVEAWGEDEKHPHQTDRCRRDLPLAGLAGGSGQSQGLLDPIPAAKALGLFSASTTCRRLPTPPSTKGRRPSRHDALRDQDMATRVRDAAREENTRTVPLRHDS